MDTTVGYLLLMVTKYLQKCALRKGGWAGITRQVHTLTVRSVVVMGPDMCECVW